LTDAQMINSTHVKAHRSAAGGKRWFHGAILPMAVLLRRLGKDLLQPKREPESASYWISREPPAPGSMRKQF
jgi:hypothetical protein